MALIPEGRYKATAIDAQSGESKNGTAYISTIWHVVEPELEVDTTRTVYTYITEKSQDIAFAQLKALKWNGDMDDPKIGVSEIELNCTHEEYQGKTREKWSFVGPERQKIDLNSDRKKAISKLYDRWIGEHPDGTELGPDETQKKTESVPF